MPNKLGSASNVRAIWERWARRVSSFHHSSKFCSNQHGPSTPYTPLCSPPVMRRVLRRSARGAEAFGFHQCRIVPELDERGRGRLHQWRRAADEDVRPFARRPGDLRQHHAVDPAPKSGPPPRGLARERERDLECLVALGQSGELTTVDHVVPSPRRVQEPCWHVVPRADVCGLERGRAVAQHRHQGHDPRAARHKK
jgi:hypothetical protein